MRRRAKTCLLCTPSFRGADQLQAQISRSITFDIIQPPATPHVNLYILHLTSIAMTMSEKASKAGAKRWLERENITN
jgi:hypothetical protein